MSNPIDYPHGPDQSGALQGMNPTPGTPRVMLTPAQEAELAILRSQAHYQAMQMMHLEQAQNFSQQNINAQNAMFVAAMNQKKGKSGATILGVWVLGFLLCVALGFSVIGCFAIPVILLILLIWTVT